MKKISRRHLLRGAGVAIALPPLELTLGSHPRAWAGGADSPKRIVLFHFPNGTYLEAWTPTSAGTGFSLPPCLEPLAGLEDEFSVLTGMSNAALHDPLFPDVNGHPLNATIFLTGAAPPTAADPEGPGLIATTVGGPSFDHVAGDLIGTGTKFKNLTVYATTGRNTPEPTSLFTWSGPNAPGPYLSDPKLMFEQLFADLETDPAVADKLAARRTSVLDYAQGSIADLEKQLGAADQARLDEYLTSLRELEEGVNATVSLECVQPDDPGAVGEFEGDELLEARTDLLLELSVMALVCDLTRVLVFSLSPTGGSVEKYPFLESDKNEHTISHYGSDTATYIERTQWFTGRFGHLLELMGAGAPGLLDDCAIACSSEMADGQAHNANFIPTLVAGRLGGMTHGQHLVYPCDASASMLVNNPVLGQYREVGGDTRIANLWLSMLEAAGADAGSFGNSTGVLDGLWV